MTAQFTLISFEDYLERHMRSNPSESREEVAAILEKARAPMQRLEAARKELRDRILAVLTPEQKASGCLPLG